LRGHKIALLMKDTMKKSLLIVESPTKARTLNRYLGKEFIVKASKGHVKDLPENKLGVDIEHDFRPEYRIIRGKEKIVRELREAAKKAETVYLGPDPDREGEAIAWHVAEEISRNGDRKPENVYRVLFYELTHSGIEQALKNPGHLNRSLYEAQQARRILDRLVGYMISPLLWQKIKRGLSAGRVQSVALRLICEREREIHRFEPREYWTVEATFKKKGESALINAKLQKVNGKKTNLNSREDANKVIEAVKKAKRFIVSSIERKRQRKNPPAPFITSTLQQDASRKLRFSPKKTMTLAQQLYEGVSLPDEGMVGLITYMRTDSTRLSEESIKAARKFISQKWGQDFLPSKPRQFKVKAAAQDAHEAIRPTDVFRTPEAVKPHLTPDQFALYELIWKRFVACQMKQASIARTGIDIIPIDAEITTVFRATGSVVEFPGFMILYEEAGDENGEPDSAVIPSVKEEEILTMISIEGKQHFTQPPPRFTEASLIKELEQNGVGRPSTYATILSTIQDRKYVVLEDRTLRPTELGFVVNDVLTKHFPEIINVSFTADMERKLDEVERGNYSFVVLLHEFYRHFKPMLEAAQKNMENFRTSGVPSGICCPECSTELTIRWGQNGDPFLACPNCRFTSNYKRNEKGEIELLQPQEVNETCPKCGKPMIVKHGRFGPFLACSGYPDCKTTKPLGLGIPCPAPDCSGEIVERRSRRGKVFYGCSRYPNCSVVFNQKPVSQSCPQCGYPIMLMKKTKSRGEQLVCANKECKYSMPLRES